MRAYEIPGLLPDHRLSSNLTRAARGDAAFRSAAYRRRMPSCADFDPRAEPLEVEVLHEWKKPA